MASKPTPLEALGQAMLPAIERELVEAIARAGDESSQELHDMLAYHLGWDGEGAGKEARGKRIRPLLVLLSCEAAGGQWQMALPASAAVELVHNFSLIHDDIQDKSPLRRGRPTVWRKWGVAQAINAGDTLFTLAHLALLRLKDTASADKCLKAVKLLQEACLRLTVGQYLDLSYEDRDDLKIDSYWPMVEGKTAALLAACTELGCLIAGKEEATQQAYRHFGRSLGLAFQVKDDLLGIWGDAALTGKSTESDLLEGKKSLPVLFALERDGPFSTRWKRGSIQPGEVAELAHQLEVETARNYTQEIADRLTQQALQFLEDARPQGRAGEALHALANSLLNRTT